MGQVRISSILSVICGRPLRLARHAKNRIPEATTLRPTEIISRLSLVANAAVFLLIFNKSVPLGDYVEHRIDLMLG
jgi:hypothetical protein